jgi:hypothetical protein
MDLKENVFVKTNKTSVIFIKTFAKVGYQKGIDKKQLIKNNSRKNKPPNNQNKN